MGQSFFPVAVSEMDIRVTLPECFGVLHHRQLDCVAQ